VISVAYLSGVVKAKSSSSDTIIGTSEVLYHSCGVFVIETFVYGVFRFSENDAAIGNIHLFIPGAGMISMFAVGSDFICVFVS